MTGYSTTGWGEMFLAAAGATAALRGLIFVGLSVNIKTVLEIDRPGAGGSGRVAAVSAISPARAVRASLRHARMSFATRLRPLLAAALTLSLALAGVTLAAGHGGGLDWLPGAFVLAVAVAAINAWVLLVEILR
jgi:hypothetical protein